DDGSRGVGGSARRGGQYVRVVGGCEGPRGHDRARLLRQAGAARPVKARVLPLRDQFAGGLEQRVGRKDSQVFAEPLPANDSLTIDEKEMSLRDSVLQVGV